MYYQFEDEPEASAEGEAAAASDAPASSTPTAVPVAAPVAAAAAPAGGAASIVDVPLKATDVLATIIAQKLKKKVDGVPLSKSIKNLVGGKSTLQNEILGDLQL